MRPGFNRMGSVAVNDLALGAHGLVDQRPAAERAP